MQVTNTGKYDGDEVAQVYAKQPDATVPVPNLRLVAFDRQHISTAASVTFELTVVPETHCAVLNNSFADIYNGVESVVVEAGRLELWVGGRQPLANEGGWISVNVTSTATLESCKG